MMDHLIKKIREKNNPSVVGLDPTLDLLPFEIKDKYFKELGKTPEGVGEAFKEFNKRIIDAIADIVPAVKPQIAMYESFGLPGLKAYIESIEYAKEKGLVIIGDIKRGDVSSTAEAYSAHLGGIEIEGNSFDLWKEDAITVNPYFGIDGIEPFIEKCRQYNKGLFVLIRTSNKSSFQLQELKIENDGRPLYFHVADLVKIWGSGLIGKEGYSSVGAVVGATHPEQGVALRKSLPNTFFLVPGYGAQGATAKDLKGFFDKNGSGAIVNSSRGIIGAWKNGKDFYAETRKAALKMKKDLERVVK